MFSNPATLGITHLGLTTLHTGPSKHGRQCVEVQGPCGITRCAQAVDNPTNKKALRSVPGWTSEASRRPTVG